MKRARRGVTRYAFVSGGDSQKSSWIHAQTCLMQRVARCRGALNFRGYAQFSQSAGSLKTSRALRKLSAPRFIPLLSKVCCQNLLSPKYIKSKSHYVLLSPTSLCAAAPYACMLLEPSFPEVYQEQVSLCFVISDDTLYCGRVEYVSDSP